MNKFTFLCFVIIGFMQFTLARVTRDVSLGYHYHPDYSSSGTGFLHPPEAVTSTSSYGPSTSGNSYFNEPSSFSLAGTSGFVPSTEIANFGKNENGFGNSRLPFTSAKNSISSSQPYYNEQTQYAHIQNQSPIITKHFYVHSAAEDHDEQQIVRYVNVGRPQQNYRVVFINAPISSISKAKIIANIAPVEDKTAIYVLAKKSNDLDVSAEVVTQRPVHHKPEVSFIKYNTLAEAEHAQQAIQAQYDSLGGSSQVSNEGIISVSSVISNHSANVDGITSSTVIDNGSIDVTGKFSQNIRSAGNVVAIGDNSQQTYLPAHHK